MNSSTNCIPDSVRAAARKYLADGFAPIPLATKSKKPVISNWQRLRVRDADVDARFAADANVGILTGTPSGGLVDVDLDCPEAIRAAAVLLPRTPMISGRHSAPRSHWWYRVGDPPDQAAESFDDPAPDNSDRRLRVELRSTGGQTLAPPSLHPSGERCVWHEQGKPALVDIGVLRAKVRGLAAAALLGRHWPRGARHNAALALAGGLVRAGWPDEMTEHFVRAVCAAAGDDEVKDRVRGVQDSADRLRRDDPATGWPRLARLLGKDGEVIVNQVRQWLGVAGMPPAARATAAKGTKPSPVPPYAPFPTALLPPVVRGYVEATAAAMNCDPAYSALPALAALGAAIGATHVASPKVGWKEPPFIWALGIGRSGAIKSPPYRDVEDLAEDINDRLEDEYQEELAKHEGELGEWEAAEKEAKKDGEDPGPKPRPPVKRAFVKGDVTIEALVGALQDNPRGLLIGQDELSAWIGGFVRYAGKSGATALPHWLQLHHAGTINLTRKTGDPARREVRVRGVGVSVTGTIQPGILSRVLTEEFRASGFLARLLLAMPPWRKRRWTESEIDEPTRRAFAGLLNDLHQLVPGSYPDGRPAPHLVRLSDDAKAMFIAFYNANGDALATAGEDMSALMSKLEGYALRFALVLHCCRWKSAAKNHTINAADMRAAIQLTEWFRSEAERVYAVLGESHEQQQARQLFDRVARLAEKHGGRVTPTQLQRANQRRYPTSESAKAALESLVGVGFGRWEVIPAGPKGGPSTRAFVPQGMCDETDETPAGGPEDDPDSDDPSGGVCDETPACDETPNNGAVRQADRESGLTHGPDGTGGVSSVSSHTPPEAQGPGGDSPDPPGWFRHTPGVSSHMAPTLVASAAGLPAVVAAVERGGGPVGLDTETTGLRHATDRVRLLSLATATGTHCIDLFQIDPADLGHLFAALAKVEVVGHNLGFDLPFLMRLGFTPGRVADTMLASQLVHAGDRSIRHGLKDVAQRTLGVTLDKELQTADWSGPLTPEMLRYAALDAQVPVRAWAVLAAEAEAAGMAGVLGIEMAAVPAVAWAATHGVGFDRHAWETVASDADARRDQLLEQLDALAPNTTDLFGVRNWNSPDEVKAAFTALGITLDSTDDDVLAAVDHPLADLLREYRSAAKRTGAYGRDWLRHVADDGRVYAHWNQLGAGSSGRMSCKQPNLQQLPRDPRYRRCFVAPSGRVLAKSDYSQIELRIAARITGETRMLDAYRDGQDLHTLTARSLLGKSEVTKADRQLAKAVNFGLLYGQGTDGLRRYALANYGVKLTEAEAARYREKFFATYPGLRRWHRSVGDQPRDTRTLAGRRRVGVARFTEILNTPVQGTGADGLKCALGLLWDRRAECPGAFPVLLVHDEIVVECDEDQAETVSAWLKKAMADGMGPLIDPVPVEVEVGVGRTWGG